jgi:hypothetical protein
VRIGIEDRRIGSTGYKENHGNTEEDFVSNGVHKFAHIALLAEAASDVAIEKVGKARENEDCKGPSPVPEFHEDGEERHKKQSKCR